MFSSGEIGISGGIAMIATATDVIQTLPSELARAA
jgi:hypothetical protein